MYFHEISCPEGSSIVARILIYFLLVQASPHLTDFLNSKMRYGLFFAMLVHRGQKLAVLKI